MFNKFLYQLRHSVLNIVWRSVSRILIAIGGPRLAAYLTYTSIDWGAINPTNKTILCLFRESFIKDVTELRQRTSFNYPMVMAGFTKFQSYWMPEAMQIQTLYQKNLDNRALEKSKLYAATLIKLVNKKTKVAGVLSGNFDYWQDNGFKQYCVDHDIPFLVLVKETPSAPAWVERDFTWYRDSEYCFTGTAMAVAGKSNKDYILKAGSIASEDQIFITGLPRYDAWLNIDTNIPYQARKLVTLLTFSMGYNADNTFIQVLDLFVALSNKVSHHQFLIKCKDAEDFHYVKKLIGKKEAPRNLMIDYQVNLFNVLPNSKITLGYNSLSLFEAAMAKTQIIIPAWGECQSIGNSAMCSSDNEDVADMVNFAFNVGEFNQMIEEGIQNIEMPSDDQVSRFINMNNYLYLPNDSTCSGEFVKFLNRFVD